jgi:DNA-binding NtrC family response regulator
MSGNNYTVMIVDRDEICCFITHQILRSANFNGTIIHFFNMEAALKHLEVALPDILIIDYYFSELYDFEILEKLKFIDIQRDTSVVLLWDTYIDAISQLTKQYHLPYKFQKPLNLINWAEVVFDLAMRPYESST